MKRIASLCCFAILILNCGCVGGIKRRPTAATLPAPTKLDIAAPVVTDGSIWQPDARSNASLISDEKARQKGDIVTILIVEKVDAKRERNTDTSKEHSIDGAVDQLFFPGVGQIGNANASIGLSGKREFKGGGSISDTGEVTATVSAQVVEVLANGNLVLMGTKEVTVAGEVQTVTLTGIARPKDITPTNTVKSTSLAEARVHIAGTGPLDDAQRRSLITRLFDWVNLF